MTYISEKETRTPLEALVAEAAQAALAAAGYELEETASAGAFVAVAPDGLRTWLKFGVEESEIVEPAPGTVVEAQVESATRRGRVTFRGPGWFVFEFAYKSGQRSTGVVTAGTPYRVVGS